MRKHVGSVVVIALALGATAYAYLADRGKVSDLERESRNHLLFPAFRKDRMHVVELVQAGKTLRFESSADDAGDREWRMTVPPQKSDSPSIDRLLGGLEYASYERKVTSGGTGFDAPRVTGTIEMTGVTYHFALGGPADTPAGAAYFRLDGEGTFVIKPELVALLLRPADAYRDRSMIPYLSIELSGVTLAGAQGAAWSIGRTDDVSFSFLAPPQFKGFRVSRTELDKFWGALADMRADSFPSPDEAAAALAHPAASFTMLPRESSLPAAKITIGGACASTPDDVVLTNGTTSACVPKTVLVGLSLPADMLVDRHPFAAIPEEVTELTLETLTTPSTKVELARKENDWHERTPVDRDLTGTVGDMATALVKAIVTAQGEATTPSQPFAPTVRVRLTRVDTNAVETVELDGTTLFRKADGAYLKLPLASARRLQPFAGAFRSPLLWPQAIDNAAIVGLATDCGGTKQEVTRDPSGTFHLRVAGKEFPVDGGNVVALAEAVERARATAWVAANDDGDAFGFGASCTAALDVQGEGGVVHALLAFGGRASEDDVYARANDDPAIFTVSRALADMAGGLLVDRSAFFVDPDSIADVTLSKAGKTVHVSGVGDAGEAAEAVLAAIASLRAEEVLHVGPAPAAEGFGSPTVEARVTSSGDGGSKTLRFAVGARMPTSDKEAPTSFVRISGLDATFSVSEASLRPLLDAFAKDGP